jgi:hypothetical protein
MRLSLLRARVSAGSALLIEIERCFIPVFARKMESSTPPCHRTASSQSSKMRWYPSTSVTIFLLWIFFVVGADTGMIVWAEM